MKLDEHALQGSMAVIDNKDCCKLLQIEKLFPFLIDLIESFLSIKEILFCRLSCKPLCHLYHREYISQYQAVDKIIFPTRHEELSNSLQQKLQKRFKNSHFTTDFCHKALFIRYLDQQTGYGLFTKQYHRKGEELGVYLGEYISTKECLRRYSDHYDTLGMNYILSISEENPSYVLRTHIDATVIGNKIRFANHACEPNVTFDMWRCLSDDDVTDCDDLLKMIAVPIMICLRDISPFEEIRFNYGEELIDTPTSTAKSQEEGEVLTGRKRSLGEEGRTVCRCGSVNKCRRYLPNLSLL